MMKLIRKYVESIYIWNLRRKTQNKNFTIISNNCWGGGVYEDLGIQYTTPTVGLFFYAPCYIRFLTNLKTYLSMPLQFKTTSYYQLDRKVTYPIGILNNDVEIHFLHYATKEEASSAWNKRKKRINFENLFMSFSDRDLCTDDLAKNFDELAFPNKVFFSSKNDTSIKCLVHLKQYNNQPYVGDIYTNRWAYRKNFNVAKWLNNKKS